MALGAVVTHVGVIFYAECGPYKGRSTASTGSIGSFNEFGFIPWGWGGDEFLLRHFGSSTSLTLIIFNTFGAIKLITLLHQHIVR